MSKRRKPLTVQSSATFSVELISAAPGPADQPRQPGDAEPQAGLPDGGGERAGDGAEHGGAQAQAGGHQQEGLVPGHQPGQPLLRPHRRHAARGGVPGPALDTAVIIIY